MRSRVTRAKRLFIVGSLFGCVRVLMRFAIDRLWRRQRGSLSQTWSLPERRSTTVRRSTLAVCVVLAAGLLAVPAQAAPGDLDPTFGTGGKVTTVFGPGANSAFAIAVQANSKIVAVGGSGSFDFALARYNADGSLDPSFGTAGKVTTDFGGFDAANGVAIQADGKIVAAGIGRERFAVARYNADGSLDPSFGTAGKVTTDFGDRSGDVAKAVAIQADGKIVAAGGGGPCTPPCEFALARYLGDPTVVPFTAFSATAEVNFRSSKFELTAIFTLGDGSDGIAPLIENVGFQFGTFSTTIPAGSFTQDKKGRLKFEGIISGVALEVAIAPLGDSTFEFKAEGKGADLTGTVNPVTVGLTIGDDDGSVMVRAELE